MKIKKYKYTAEWNDKNNNSGIEKWIHKRERNTEENPRWNEDGTAISQFEMTGESLINRMNKVEKNTKTEQCSWRIGLLRWRIWFFFKEQRNEIYRKCETSWEDQI